MRRLHLPQVSLPPSSSLIGGRNHLPCQSTPSFFLTGSPSTQPHRSSRLSRRLTRRAIAPSSLAVLLCLHRCCTSLSSSSSFSSSHLPPISLAPDPSLSRSIRRLAATALPLALPPSSPTAPLFSLLSRQRQGRSWSHSGPFWWAKLFSHFCSSASRFLLCCNQQ